MLKKLVRQAGQMFLDSTSVRTIEKAESDFVTTVDLRVHDFLHKQLPLLLPDSRVLSEEDDRERIALNGDVWIIDPVDGTSNFVYGLQHSCVSVGRLQNGEPVEGVIYNPFLDELFYASKGCGAEMNGSQIHAAAAQSLGQAFIGFEAGPASKHHYQRTLRMMDACCQRTNGIRMLGSSALDIAYVACGRFTGAYFDYLYPWDYAAGAVLLMEAGGRLTNTQGETPSYAGKDAFVASNGTLHEALMELLREAE